MAIKVCPGCSIIVGFPYSSASVLRMPGDIIKCFPSSKEEEYIDQGFAVRVEEGSAPSPEMQDVRVPVPPGTQIPATLSGPDRVGDAISLDSEKPGTSNSIKTKGKTAEPPAKSTKTPISKFTFNPTVVAKMNDNEVVAALTEADPDMAAEVTDIGAIRVVLSRDFR